MTSTSDDSTFAEIVGTEVDTSDRLAAIDHQIATLSARVKATSPRFAALVPDRVTRLVVGIVFLWACFLGAFSGGWFLIPAGIAFMLYDWRSNGRAVAQNAKE